MEDYSNCHGNKRLRGNGWGNGQVRPMVEVAVKITCAKVCCPARPNLKARIGRPFGHHGCYRISVCKSSGGQTKKKGKSEVRNWRQRPVRVRARANAPFHRTLPGELSRAIIVARIMSSSVKVCTSDVGAADVSCDVTDAHPNVDVDVDANGGANAGANADADVNADVSTDADVKADVNSDADVHADHDHNDVQLPG